MWTPTLMHADSFHLLAVYAQSWMDCPHFLEVPEVYFVFSNQDQVVLPAPDCQPPPLYRPQLCDH